MFSLPSPGDVVTGIGHAIQGAENFVSGALNGAINAVENHADAQPSTAMVSNPQNPQAGSAALDGVVSIADFQRFQKAVVKGFLAVREDIASIRAYGADGESGALYGSSRDDNSGGGFGGGNPLMMILLLQAIQGTSPTSSLTTLLPLMLLMGGGGSGFSLSTFLAMGLL